MCNVIESNVTGEYMFIKIQPQAVFKANLIVNF